MSVRNCGELGTNLQKIVSRLISNDDLVKLLYYTEKDPLGQPSLTVTEKQERIYEELIRIVPRIPPREDARSIISMRVLNSQNLDSNSEFRNVTIAFEIFVPLTQWIIKDSNLRPFAIMGQIQSSLNNKKVNGLGKIQGGDFELKFLTEEMSCYEQIFQITTYD